ncbi:MULTISPECIES: glutamate 5-kinase [Clostridium]|uniref:Glutamate 5-kinase n=4 Tax=Clostridium TaxID=1485 RepID=D8GN57_CLOLD|nr:MULTISPECIES: glutamate 5-kinase [Clostridium]ADK13681.1 glutamate 5-kinase [Clostridium ljungdahlii DSM 13528]AGY76904.1 glutamate 5-kinase [Clostridium autoethanogenum DSM 10061]ALU37050.1 Gamma-glutamyl kinase [Clostridium autoethanogenum DSM 10061]OAA84493.1 Glutamate 5-kinase 1 [Clostridium ljungdahlii DSM 13528]OAA92806.1 Glutamate 5-kinase 1 [Clostridium coskatii]
MNIREKYLKDAKKVVVKVGTSTLITEDGSLDLYRIEEIVRQICYLQNQGKSVVLVTSGAIGVGFLKLGLKTKPKDICEKQAAAAIGQGILLNIYEKMFSEHGKIVAQILLTKNDLDIVDNYTHAQNTFTALLKRGVIPIVNENDAVAVEEIKFGDNDTLSALIAKTIHADLLILLSDIDGLYSSDPQSDKDAKLISCVPKITKEIEDCSKGSHSNVGTGGMYTKIKAAKIAVSSGISMIIANGSQDSVIEDIVSNKEIGTLFEAEK